MTRAFLLIMLMGLSTPPPCLAQKVRLHGDPVFYAPIQIGGATGRIIKVDDRGLYVSIPKSSNDSETRTYIGAYKHGEWDYANWLLLIPHSALTRDGEEADAPISEAAPGQDSGFHCYLDGKSAAKTQVGTTGNFIGGLVGGLFLGYLGAGIAVISADRPNAPLSREGEPQECHLSFVAGYEEEGQSKKRLAAARGGIIGSALLLAVYFVAASY